MLDKLQKVEEKFLELERALSEDGVYSDQERYRQLTKQHSDLKDIVEPYRDYQSIIAQIENNKLLLSDKDQEICLLAQMELDSLNEDLIKREGELKALLIPKDPLDKKNIILEIRAGTGGDEAALFVADLFRMYSRYAEVRGWRTEIMSANETGTGGFKEIFALIAGNNVYSRLKYESGVHRVQRVPATETQGRIHTSAVTVAILPEAEEVDLDIPPSEIRVDVFRSSGPGGQSVNTTDSAIRLTHIPTGLIVTCQDEKSQHKNKAKAMKVLMSRLLQQAQDERKREYDAHRKSQIGSGDRSERIRTYNYPQGRVTDHRINLTLYSLESVMDGHVNELFDALIAAAQAEALQAELQ